MPRLEHLLAQLLDARQRALALRDAHPCAALRRRLIGRELRREGRVVVRLALLARAVVGVPVVGAGGVGRVGWIGGRVAQLGRRGKGREEGVERLRLSVRADELVRRDLGRLARRRAGLLARSRRDGRSRRRRTRSSWGAAGWKEGLCARRGRVSHGRPAAGSARADAPAP